MFTDQLRKNNLKLLAETNGIQCLPIVEKQQPIDITKRALNAANLMVLTLLYLILQEELR